jgi:hypothetical protein
MKLRIILGATLLCLAVAASAADNKRAHRELKGYTPHHQNDKELVPLDRKNRLHPDKQLPMPLRAVSATQSLLDSLVETDADGVVLSKEVYEYNTKGERIRLTAYDTNTSGVLVFAAKAEYTYDAYGYVSRYIYSNWSNGQWLAQYRYDYANDASGRTTQYTYYEWSNNEWLGLYRYDYTYTGSTNYYKERIESFWETNTKQWIYSSKTVQDIWDTGYSIAYYHREGNAWLGDYKDEYTYEDAYGSTSYGDWSKEAATWTTKTVEGWDLKFGVDYEAKYEWENNTWKAISKIGEDVEDENHVLYYYVVNNDFVPGYEEYQEFDDYGNETYYYRYDWIETENDWIRTLYRQQTWDNLSDTWQIVQKLEIAYDLAERELYRIQLYRNDSQSPWIENYTYKQEYTYDDKGNRTLYMLYNYVNENWAPVSKTVDTRDGQGRMQVRIDYILINNTYVTNAWVEIGRSTYYYSDHDVTGTASPEALSVQVSLGPNPAQNYFTITGAAAGSEISISSLDGQVVGRYAAQAGSTQISVSDWANGVYLVKIGKETVKVLKN